MTNDRGFSEVELIVSLVIFMVGVLGAVGLIGAGYRYQGQSKLETEMTVLAETKIEELRAFASTDLADTVALNIGGDLDVDVVGHVDTVETSTGWVFVRRWEIVAGPAGTREITVRIRPLTPPAAGQADLSTTVLHE